MQGYNTILSNLHMGPNSYHKSNFKDPPEKPLRLSRALSKVSIKGWILFSDLPGAPGPCLPPVHHVRP